eukprot:CAMPEP_0173118248 /NCGR_PEP_ID=MMETSP1102-20130122/50862_1 /TAXON_ID=49646 /ORGANISM="Geminigera sp., Strain Caron Lab Isolate" /LENGTH=83 /DNA_ID=CAMNT_0014023197 /DNA_START=389 /DNA_END=637 /DNA_ORIENTATION=+
MKNHEHRTQDMFTPFRAHYMLLHLPATPTHNKDGSIGPKLRDHKEQLYRAATQYSLVEFNDVSERDSCWERRLLISRGKMKGG